jgi:hypothetical protein
MEKKKLGSILTGIGIVVLLISVFADFLGIGGYPGLGYKQIIGAISGIVIGIIGSRLYGK